ncbi:MAG TPA: pyridoxine 5'-phosphate synthase [Gemmatimonadaceae bacterium]|jgi:pyridoxine 5-phosphate synthase|nr:pyridoxine 5'-phosphate synthase [Gemmatimonadaceae bacterium]
MTKLSVNLNKVALVRNTRALGIPGVVRAAELSVKAGAQGITVHPRPDQRHIRPGDVRDLAAYLRDHPGVEYNIEGNPFHQLMALVREIRPDQCTLVPDSEQQSTSDHGWSIQDDGKRLAPVVRELEDLGVRVSLFMDIDSHEWEAAAALGVDRVELYTEPYARAHATGDYERVLSMCRTAALDAQSAGLGVNAGHDLNRDNLGAFHDAVPNVLEVSIGHALIADALEMGLPAAVKAYLSILQAKR